MIITAVWISGAAVQGFRRGPPNRIANTATDKLVCDGAGDVTPDQQIRSCTALIRIGGQSNSQLSRAYSNRGDAYEQERNHERALADDNGAIRLNPNNAEAYNNRGTIYADQRDFARAFADDHSTRPVSGPRFLQPRRLFTASRRTTTERWTITIGRYSSIGITHPSSSIVATSTWPEEITTELSLISTTHSS